MLHVASAYPFHAGSPTVAGPFLGLNLTAGGAGWFFDPFELYGTDLGGGHQLTNSNMLILGEPGFGKSTAAKTILYRQAGFYGPRRFIAISDPKGEYRPLADALAIPTIRLHPGGTDRINPLDPGPGDPALSLLNRHALIQGLLALVLRRDLTPIEDAVVTHTITHLDRHVRGAVLGDLHRLIAHPPAELAAHPDLDGIPSGELTSARTQLRLALGKLLERALRGMFDGPTTVTIDWRTAPGLVLDLSAVFNNKDALQLVQMTTTSWLTTQMADLHAQGRRGILVEDEVWATTASERAARHLQDRLKLCRLYGIWNILITHRLSDLQAQADDGTAAHKITAGLLADIQTIVAFQQAPNEATLAASMLNLPSQQVRLLGRLPRGRALWRIAGHASIIEHLVSDAESTIVETNAAMNALG